MKFRSIKNWKSPDTSKGLLFFAQRMDELTFSYTLDSYRAPTTTAPFLLREAIRSFELCDELGISPNGALHILDELETRLRKNPIVSELLSLRLERYVNYDRSDIGAILRKLRVLQAELDARTYTMTAFDLVKSAVETEKKFEIDFLAREIAANLQNQGVSEQHLNKTILTTFFSNEEVSGPEVLVKLFRELFPHSHKYDIALKITTSIGNVRKEILKIFDMELATELPDEFREPTVRQWFLTLDKGENYLVLKGIRAPDSSSAMQVANNRIERLHDLFGLYYHKGSFSLSPFGLTKKTCCDKSQVSIRTAVNRMHFVSDNRPHKAAQKLDEMIKKVNFPGGDDREKFFRAISFHGKSIQTESVENQLINLWTSLETIVPRRKGQSIIREVVDGVLPFLGLQYFNRIFWRLATDLNRWNRDIALELLDTVEAPDGADLSEKAFCLVANKQNSDKLKKLFGDLGHFELLRYRTFCLWQAFDDPRNAHRILIEHQKRVEWQLHRIYRARNSIVHSGLTPAFTPVLVVNAHDYFDQIFDLSNELSSGKNGQKNYSSCFDYAEWLFAQYQSDLKKTATFDVESCGRVIWKRKPVLQKTDFFKFD
jgi:hypothetical protein